MVSGPPPHKLNVIFDDYLRVVCHLKAECPYFDMIKD